jgi:hypothetical protein
MAYSYNGSTQYHENTSLAQTFPLTFACWFYVPSAGFGNTLMNSGGDASLHYHWMTAHDSSKTVQVASRSGLGGSSASTTTNWSDDTWHHACTVIASATSRSVFLDGGGKATNIGSQSPTINQFNLAVRFYNATYAQHHNGYIAEAAVWNVALTDSEVVILASRAYPLSVRLQSVVSYWPLMRSPIDIRGNYELTAAGSPSAVDHPPIVYPVPQLWVPAPPAAGGALIQLSATLTWQTATPSATLAIQRQLQAVSGWATTTPSATLAIQRQLSATNTWASTTPDVVTLAILRQLVATSAWATTTPDVVTLVIQRQLAATVAWATTTPGVTVAVQRQR